MNSPQTFTETAQAIGRVTDEKHVAYGRALEVVPQLLALLLAPTPPERLKDASFLADVQVMTRVLEKFCRLCGPDPEAYGENPWVDAAGYALGRAHLLTLELEARTPQAAVSAVDQMVALHDTLSEVMPEITQDTVRTLYAAGLRLQEPRRAE